MNNARSDNAKPTLTCQELCQRLQLKRAVSVDVGFDIVTNADSLLVQETLNKCTHIEAVKISMGSSATHWTCLVDFLPLSNSLRKVGLHGCITGDVLMALGKNRGVKGIAVNATIRQVGAIALASFFGLLTCHEFHTSPSLERLGLNLYSDEVQDRVKPAIAANESIRRLVIHQGWLDQELTCSNFYALFMQSLPRRLEQLCFSFCKTSFDESEVPVWCARLQLDLLSAMREHSYLKSLILKGWRMESSVEERLLDYLRTTAVLKRLRIEGPRTHLQWNGMCKAICDNPSIGHFELGLDYADDETCSIFSAFLRQNGHVETFTLGIDRPTDSGLLEITKGLASNQSISTMRLDTKEWSAPKTRILLEECVQKNPRLKTLVLNLGETDVESISTLCALPQANESLSSLKLMWEGVNDLDITNVLTAMETNYTLQTLEFGYFEFYETEILRLPAALERLQSLRVLVLHNYDYDEISAEFDLVSCLDRNLSLFEVRGTFFAPHGRRPEKMDRILRRNRHLADLSMGGWLPATLWPRVMQVALRNPFAGPSCIYSQLRSNLKWFRNNRKSDVLRKRPRDQLVVM